MILENQRFKSTISVEDGDFLIVERSPENVRRGVDVGIHKPGDWTYRRWRGWKDSNLSEYYARIPQPLF